MSDRQLKVVVTGDAAGAKRAFQEVSTGAQTMGRSIEESSQRSRASMETVGRTAQALGAAIGVTAILTSKANADAEQSNARLRASVEATGAAFEDYEKQISAASDAGLKLAFDDEDLQDSISQLIQATGNVSQSINDMGLAEDIARGRGISLADAARIVGLAEQGRTGTLVRLGIQIDANATKEEALAALQQRYAGQAEAYSKTTAASWERIGNTIENVAEGVGAHLTAIQGPLIALSAGSSALGTLAPVLKSAATSAGITSAALGPVGLGVGLAAAVAGFVLLTDRTSEWEDAATAAANTAISLKDRIGQLAATGQGATATALADVNEEWSALSKTGADLVHQIADVDQQISDIESRKSNAQPPLTTAEQLDLSQQIDQLRAYRAELEKLALSNDAINEITKDILDLFQKPGIDAGKASQDIAYYFDLFEKGLIDQKTLVSYLDESASDWTRYSTSVTQTTAAQDAFNQAMQKTLDMMNVQTAGLTQIPAATKMAEAARVEASLGAYGRISVAVATSSKEFSDGARAQETSMGALIEATNRGSAAFAADVDVMKAHAEASGDAIIATFQAQQQAVEAQQKALESYQRTLGTKAVTPDHSAHFAVNANRASDALGNVFGAVVNNTSAIGQQSEQVAKWADELIGVKGTWAEIDDLLKGGKITLDEYNSAQSAATSIFTANAQIQQDILKIQTDQAPVIAALTEEQQRYMDHLASLSPDQQFLRLAYMDSAEAAKALTLQQLALSAATGELGEAGEQTAQTMIEAQAAADPALKAMLIDMGVISEGADGTITVNFGDVDGANVSMGALIDDIDRLIELIAETMHIRIEDSEVTIARDHTSQLNSELDRAAVGRHASVTTDFVSNYYSTGSPSVGPGGGGLGSYLGGVLGYARGGVVAELAEYGPELLHFANGGTAWAMNRGLYSVPNNTYVTPANASKPGPGAVVMHNPVFNIYPQPGSSVMAEITELAYGASRS